MFSMYLKHGVVLGLIMCILAPGLAAAKTVSNDFDSEYALWDSSIYIFHPAFWVGTDLQFKTVRGSTVDVAAIVNLQEQNIKRIRTVDAFKSDAPGIFDLPKALTDKLEPIDLVNYYMDLMQ